MYGARWLLDRSNCAYSDMFLSAVQCVDGPVCCVCLLCALAPGNVSGTAHFFSGFNEYADDDFSVSVCVCVHAGVCVCMCVCVSAHCH